MRTDIDLDGDLEEEAPHYAGISRQKEPVDLTLQGPVASLEELGGTGGIWPDYDYKKLRNGV